MNYLRYQIRHSTIYDYSAQVTEADHVIKLKPRELPRQRLHSFELHVSPTCEMNTPLADYFGNESAVVTHRQALTQLEITARSEVDVALPYIPNPAETPVWETVRGRILTDRSVASLEAIECTYESDMVDTPNGIADYALESFFPRRPVLEAAKELTERIFNDFAFDPSATTTTTPVSEVFANRRGVCQDFAHFQIACLRSIGMAARYVSGYLETDPPPGSPRLVGADASHAWVSIYCPEIGWIDLDPTNGCLPSLRHITIGWGRDYYDICPIRGVVNGGGNPILSVGVDVLAQGPVQEDVSHNLVPANESTLPSSS